MLQVTIKPIAGFYLGGGGGGGAIHWGLIVPWAGRGGQYITVHIH